MSEPADPIVTKAAIDAACRELDKLPAETTMYLVATLHPEGTIRIAANMSVDMTRVLADHLIRKADSADIHRMLLGTAKWPTKETS